MSGRSAMRRSYGQALRRRSVVSRLGDRVLCRTLRSRSPRDCIDAPRPGDRILRRCAVAFDTGDAPAAGSLVVTDAAVWLSGRCHGEPVELGIPRDELTRVRIGRSSGERLNGYSTVVLERRIGADVLVAPFGFGLLHEIAELLGSINVRPIRPSERLELIVPIRNGSHPQVRRLVSSGPPFEPAKLGLRRHDVYLDQDHVRFVFEGDGVRGHCSTCSAMRRCGAPASHGDAIWPGVRT
jgi:hypothetical protein